MFKIGVATFIWTENFVEKDLYIIDKAKELGFDAIDICISHPENFPSKQVKERVKEVGIEVVTTTVLGKETNLIDPDEKVRKKGIEFLKKVIDIDYALDAKILGGVNYAGWGCLSGKPRTTDEWNWSVEAMKAAAGYAKENGDLVIAVEPVNRFETHFLNIAEDAVKYCKDVNGNGDVGNVKVHLDAFHMIREELSFTKAVETCGKDFLGYVHVCENNRGIPGTGLVPWKEFFTAIKKSGYGGPLVIESFDPSFEELNRMCAIWRKFANSGEELAVKGLANLRKIAESIE
ncbi:MAG: sugar phosphate isomerase/epimerase family protein [Candidatus Humimicrobiaceae bacterium]